jgi:hypothetical protein
MVKTPAGRESPVSMTMHNFWLPAIGASVELKRGNAARAIDLLQTTSHYELGSTELFQVGTMYPVYLRGLAYLKEGQANDASGEFQKILDHRSVILNFPLGALAHLQLARARTMDHDNDAARKAYQDFFTLWKDADPNVPILQQAKLEYAQLR